MVILLGGGRVTGAVSRPGGVEGTGGIYLTIRLRLFGDRTGLFKTTITSFVGRGRGLLASVELSAVGGRARLLAVGGSKAGAPRCRAKTARGALRPLGAAVGIPTAVLAREVAGIKRVYGVR